MHLRWVRQVNDGLAFSHDGTFFDDEFTTTAAAALVGMNDLAGLRSGDLALVDLSGNFASFFPIDALAL